jgi:AcrR family transcriptional regulator
VGPATLYRRFGKKDALVREVLGLFFRRLIDLARQAYAEPPERCLDVYLDSMGWELAASRGFMHGMWGDHAPAPLVRELEEMTGDLLAKARQGGVSGGDGRRHRGRDLGVAGHRPDQWRGRAGCLAPARHLLLAGFRVPVDHSAAALTAQQIAAAVAATHRR